MRTCSLCSTPQNFLPKLVSSKEEEEEAAAAEKNMSFNKISLFVQSGHIFSYLTTPKMQNVCTKMSTSHVVGLEHGSATYLVFSLGIRSTQTYCEKPLASPYSSNSHCTRPVDTARKT